MLLNKNLFLRTTHYRTDNCECGVYWRFWHTTDDGTIIEFGHYQSSVDESFPIEFVQSSAYRVSDVLWFFRSFFYRYILLGGWTQAIATPCLEGDNFEED